MRKLTVFVLAAMLLLSSGSAWAEGFELIPFVGYRFGGGLSSLSGVQKFDTEDTFSFGAAVDYVLQSNDAVEVYWGHFSGDAEATLALGPKITSTLNRDDVMLNGIWFLGSKLNSTRPYFSLGLGASIINGENTDTVGRFAWSVGGGIRRDASEGLGIRLDARWIPSWVTTGSGVWCDPFYGCFTTGTGEYYDQFEISFGLILNPGGS
jgi:hypothetical protein